MKFSLMITQGSNQGKTIPITKSEFSIGRDSQCNLRPASQHVSKKHCTLRIKGDKAFIEDHGSTNGTFVNEAPVKGERELHDGDKLKVGPLDFVVKLEGVQAEKPTHVEKETQVPQPKPAPAKAPAPAAAAAKASAPAKAPAKTPAGEENLDEDAIGSMLLSLSDEQAPDESDSFASGSTLMQQLKPEEMEQLQNAQENKTPYRPKPSNQGTNANTSQAAKNILEKYRRRPKS